MGHRHPASLAALQPPRPGHRGAGRGGGRAVGTKNKITKDDVEGVLRDIVQVDVGDLFRRADGQWRRALFTADLAELPKHVTRAIQSIRIRRPGRTQWITKYRADGMVKERRELPPAEAQGDNEVEVVFYSKTDAAEKIAKLRGWFPREDTSASLDALVTRLQQARQISVTQTNVTVTLPEPPAASTIDVTPEPEPLPLLDAPDPEDDGTGG